MTTLTTAQLERFHRNILLAEVGEQGQARLLDARVLIVGLGGLGSPVALYLAAAGVGTLGLADGDRVDVTNLQRQVLHSTGDVGRLKVESASVKLSAINPAIVIEPVPSFLDKATLRTAIARYDFIIDATDNIGAKFNINDACVELGKPFSHGGIFQFCGEAMTVVPPASACYRCAYPGHAADPAAPTAPVAGPLGPVAGIIGCIQATECLKYLLGMRDLLTDTLLAMDAMTMDFRKTKVKRRAGCIGCGRKRTGI